MSLTVSLSHCLTISRLDSTDLGSVAATATETDTTQTTMSAVTKRTNKPLLVLTLGARSLAFR